MIEKERVGKIDLSYLSLVPDNPTKFILDLVSGQLRILKFYVFVFKRGGM